MGGDTRVDAKPIIIGSPEFSQDANIDTVLYLNFDQNLSTRYVLASRWFEVLVAATVSSFNAVERYRTTMAATNVVSYTKSDSSDSHRLAPSQAGGAAEAATTRALRSSSAMYSQLTWRCLGWFFRNPSGVLSRMKPVISFSLLRP